MKNALKRTLSLMLTVVMLVSCWVFTAPKADAATAGTYDVRIKFKCTEPGDDWKNGYSYDGGNRKNDSKNMVGVTLFHKSNNGTGTETHSDYDLRYYMDNETGKDHYLQFNDVGFPSSVYAYIDHGGAFDNAIYELYTLEVTNHGGSSYTTLWQGTFHLESTSKWYDAQLWSDGNYHNDSSKYGYVSGAYAWTSSFPYAASITAAGSGVSSKDVPKDGNDSTANTAFSLGTVKDQYGVNWKDAPTLSIVNSSGNTETGVSLSSNKLKLTPAANRKDNYTMYIKETCGSATNTGKTVTINVFDYIVQFKNEDGTVLKTQNNIDYGGSATTPSTPSKPYDDSKHYTFSSWSGTYQNLTTGAQTKTVTATYTGTAHSGWTYSEISGNHTNHTKKCGSCNYSTPVVHTYGAPTITFADDGKTATAKRVCTTSGCRHTETKSLSMESGGGITSAVQIPATCTGTGVTTYTATSPFGDGATDTKDVADIPALGHAWGEYTQVLAPTCTTVGSEQRTCSRCDQTEARDIAALGHTKVAVPSSPKDGVEDTGAVYFQCNNGCGTYWAAEYNAEKEEYDPSETEYTSIKQAKNNSDPVPAPEFNSFVDDDEATFGPEGYAYETRGASLKIAAPYEYTDENTKQGMRFTASLHVPEGVEIGNSGTGNRITDFGFVYTQTQYVDDDESFKIGKPNMYTMSVVKNNAGKGAFNGSNWTGVTLHNNDDYDGQTLTYNLVINVKARNWQENYCARAFIKYSYNGFDYEVYDKEPTNSSRSVAYIAQCVVGNVKGESLRVREYCQHKILDHLA